MAFSAAVITPYGIVAQQDDVAFVFANGTGGDLGILPGHSPLLAPLRIGAVRIRSSKGVEHFAVGGGLLEASPTKVTITVESAEHVRHIDLDRAHQARKRAQERLARKQDDVDIMRAEGALARALNRIHIVRQKEG